MIHDINFLPRDKIGLLEDKIGYRVRRFQKFLPFAVKEESRHERLGLKLKLTI